MANPTLPAPPTENEDPWWPTRSAFDNAVKLAVESQLAALDSPIFTGNPTAPTPSVGDNDTSLATTAFVGTAITNAAPPNASITNYGIGEVGTQTEVNTGTDTTRWVTPATLKGQNYLAPLASPVFTGNPTAPTPTAGDNDTSIATTAFVQAANGFLIPKSLIDAKGDILAGSANDTVVRVAVGADGTFLKADSAAAAGVSWGTPAGGGAGTRVLPPIGGLFGPEAYRQVTLNSNQFETAFRGFVRILIPKAMSIDGLYVHVFTADATATVGLALWKCDDGMTVYPSTRVAQGTLTPSANGIQGATFGAVALTPGWYLAAAAASSNSTLRMYSVHDNVTFIEGVSGDIPNESRRVQFTSAAGAYNAPAATITDLEGSGADNTIWVGLRRAS